MDIESNTTAQNPPAKEEELQLQSSMAGDTVQSDQLEDPSLLSSFDKITHSNPKIRALFYVELLEKIEREKAIAEEKVASYLKNNSDMLMAENVVENQKFVLMLCQKIEHLKLEEGAADLAKKSFWYNFFDKYLCSSKGFIKDEAWKLFENLLLRTEKSFFMSLSIEFLGKNNVKIQKLVLYILNSKFQLFESWQNHLPTILTILDKFLLSPNPEIKSGAINLLKNLSTLFSIEILKGMKNVKLPLMEDVRAFLISKGLNPTCQNFGKEANGESREALKKKAVDLYKTAEPVNIVDKFNENWAEKVLSFEKWSEKKEMIDAFLKAANVPRLQVQNYSHIIGLAKRLLADSNMHVQICGIKAFGAIARGLRNNARSYIRPNLAFLFSKFKDKKTPVLDSLHTAFIEFLHCLSLEELSEEIKTFSAPRNKDIRMNVLRFVKNIFEFVMERESIQNPESKPLLSFVKLFGAILNQYYEDPDNEVRKLTNDIVLGIQDNFKDSSFQEMLLKFIEPSKIRARPKIENPQPTPIKSGLEQEEAPKSANSPPPLKKSNISKILRSCEKNQKNLELSKINLKEVTYYSYKFSEILEEEAAAFMREIFGEPMIEMIRNSNSKAKTEGLQSLSQTIKGMEPIRMDQRFVLCLCTFLKKELKDFKESNVLIIKEAFENFEVLFDRLEAVEDLFASFCALMAKKLCEPKFKVPIQKILLVCKSKLQFHKILNLMLNIEEVASNPKQICEVLTLASELFDAESTYIFQDLKRVLFAGLNNSNQGARTSAIAFFRVIAPYVPQNQLKEIIKGLENANLARQLEKEILPLSSDPKSLLESNPIQPFLTESIIEGMPAEQVNAKNTAARRNSSPMNVSIDHPNELGRRRISQEIQRRTGFSNLQEMVSGLNKPDWKTRKEALEAYFVHLANNPGCFSALNINETYQNISLRLQDSSKAVVLAALTGLRPLIETHFNQLKPYNKIFINFFLESLCDKNVN